MAVPKIRIKGYTDEWVKKGLTDTVELFGGLTYTPSNIRESGTLVLRSSNVQNGEISLLDNVFVESSVVNSPFVQKGDIIVVVRNGSRALIGKHAHIKEDINNAVIGAFMSGIRHKNSEFINALLDTSNFHSEVDKNLGATINQITNATFRSMIFNFPSDAEQRALGNFFDTLDNQITMQTSRIATLKQTKQACLQSMFPQEGETKPRVRFKGFTDDWKKVEIGKYGDTYSGLSGKSKDDFGKGNAKYITFLNVLTNAQINTYILESVDVKTGEGQNAVQKGDILFNTSSETPEEVGLCSVLLEDIPNVYLNSFCFGFRPNNPAINSEFLVYLMRGHIGRSIMKVLAQGATRYNLSKKRLCETLIPIPTNIDEQKLIAEYFSNLDKQISIQEQRLEKLKQIKSACLKNMFV